MMWHTQSQLHPHADNCHSLHTVMLMGGYKTPLPIFLSPFTSSALIITISFITTFQPVSANSLHCTLQISSSLIFSTFSISSHNSQQIDPINSSLFGFNLTMEALVYILVVLASYRGQKDPDSHWEQLIFVTFYRNMQILVPTSIIVLLFFSAHLKI